MKLVYFSHSFRDNDIDVNKHFVTLLSNRGLEVNLDAFTKPGELNAAQPMRQIRYNDGLVAVWPWRAGEISKFIPFEIMLGVRAKKPVLVFIEDKLPEDILPLGILQCRFRREYLVREIKRHYHSIDLFNSYLPENPPPSYSINISRRICLLVSDPGVQEPVKAAVRDELTDSGYHVDELDSSSELAVSDEKLFRRVLATDLAIIISEGDSQPPKFITGILIGHLVPSVMFTLASNPKISNNSPEEYQPKSLVSPSDPEAIRFQVKKEIAIYERDYEDIKDKIDVVDYFKRMYAKRSAKGGDTLVNVSGDYIQGRIGNVGSGGSAVIGKNNTVTYSGEQKRWVDAQTKNHDGMRLLKIELEDLRREMALRARSSADNDQISAIWKAEEAAEQLDPGRVLDNLKAAGASIFDVAKELAKDLAKEAIKAACGF